MNYGKATSWAANIGKGIAIAMAIFGIIILNIWLVIISVFLFFGANQEQKMVKISLALEDKKVEDIMDKNVKSISPNTNIKDLLGILREDKSLIYPVVDNNKLIGIVTINDVQKIDKENIENIFVKDIMRKDFSKISPEQKAISAFKTLSKDKYNKLFVEKDSKILGVITQNDIIHTLKMSGI